MIFLDPRTDMVFKKLFGDATHKNIVISFLNSVLQRAQGKQIVDVTMNDPHNVPETQDSKASVVDVRCIDQAGFQYIVEMQVSAQEDYGSRALYYSALAMSRQLKKGEEYKEIMPVIFVGVLDFKLFKEHSNYLSHHALLDLETFKCDLRKLEYHFIELPKFKKTLEQLDTILDKWIYFLKNAGSLRTIPASFQEPVLKEAFDVLEQANWSTGELEAYDKVLDAERSYKNQMRTAKIEGREEERIRLAEQLIKLNMLDISTIAQVTGLTVEHIEEFKKNGGLT